MAEVRELLDSAGGVLTSARVVSEPSGHLGGPVTLKGGQDWDWEAVRVQQWMS